MAEAYVNDTCYEPIIQIDHNFQMMSCDYDLAYCEMITLDLVFSIEIQ